MSLKDRITEDMKSAMRAGDKARLAAIRLILAGIKQREIDERKTLSDEEIVATLDRMRKQRRESIAQYEKAGRTDLVEKEAFELEVIEAYLPSPLSEEEIEGLIDQALAETGASGPKEMGKVMGWLKPRLAGRADMGEVSRRVRARLSS
ncbi:MAG: GatB/YqeY domain-containing protein [Gammaproteobacteria bacterium]|nr:MAG: GatB/YqeY domain-containing protein [Gammaproteobacteria bacterium]